MWSCHSPACSPRARGGGPSCATRPCRSTTARSISGANGPSSCRITTTVVPGVVQAADRLDERRLRRDVDAGRRLVEDEQVGSAHEGPGDQHALLLAAGHLLHRAGARGRPGRRRRARRGPAAGARAVRRERAAVQQPGRDHLERGRGHARGGGQALRHVADAVPGRRRAERRAEQPDGPGGRRDDAEQAAHERRLARSRWRRAAPAPRPARPPGRCRRGSAARRWSRRGPSPRSRARLITDAHEQSRAVRRASRLRSAIEK